MSIKHSNTHTHINNYFLFLIPRNDKILTPGMNILLYYIKHSKNNKIYLSTVKSTKT